MLLALFMFAGQLREAHAFKHIVHAEITRSALRYLEDNRTTYPEAGRWLQGPAEGRAQLQSTLIAGAIEADFRPDTWFKSLFHKPVTGIYVDGEITLFSSLLHFMLPESRVWWGGLMSDGIAFPLTSNGPNDSYLDIFSLEIAGESSAAFGGNHPEHPIGRHGALGSYHETFKGSMDDWNHMFFGGNLVGNVFFPPASLLAEHAYRAFLRSERAAESSRVCWNETLPLVSSITGTTFFARKYCRSTVKSMPKALDLLGMALHLGQDLAIPQHVIGTLDLCHDETEKLASRLVTAGNGSRNLYALYDSGAYQDAPQPPYQALYDASLVKQLKSKFDFLDPKAKFTFSERMRAMAREVAKWRWSMTKKWFTTTLPNGKSSRARSCAELLDHSEIRAQLKYQYNLAVALSACFFEQAAQTYELWHPTNSP